MAIEVDRNTPDDQTPEQEQSDSGGSRPRQKDRRRLWNRGTLVFISLIIVIAVGASIPLTRTNKKDLGPKLTYTVARGPLLVTVIEEGKLESAENLEIKNKVRGANTVIWVIESGSIVKKGDELLRMDTLFIEEQINERSKYAHWSRSAAEGSDGRVKAQKIAIEAFEKGTFKQQEMSLQKELLAATTRFNSNTSILAYQEQMRDRGYVSDLRVEQMKMRLQASRLNMELKQTQLNVLRDFKKKEELQKLKGRYNATKATHKANVERAFADASRRDRAVEESKYTTVRAPRDGMVIHPNAARWRNAPSVAEGATVWKDLVLLLMPDLNQMQVKIGVHESVVDRVKTGLRAQVIVTGRKLRGRIGKVASVTSPAVWWNGNRVEYDTIVKLPNVPGLMPGMSAEVEILVASYDDVLKIPVASIIEVTEGSYCWVKSGDQIERRKLELGDSNDVHSIVKSGVDEGEEVVLDPLSIVEAKRMVELDAKAKEERSKPKKLESGEGKQAVPSKKNSKAKPVKQSGSKKEAKQ